MPKLGVTPISSDWPQTRAKPRHTFLVSLVVAGALACIAVGPFLLDTYLVNILIRAFFVAVVALTIDVLWGYTGILTFGQSAFFGIGAYAAALIFTHVGFNAGTVLLAIALAISGAAVVAALVGWLSFYPGSTPLFASAISLVLPVAVVQALYSGGTFTGSSSGLVGYTVFDLSLEAWFWISGFACVAVAALTWIVMRSDASRVLLAIRDNEARCTYLGLDTPRIKIVLLVVCSVFAALAGFGYACFSGVVAPELASFVFGTELVIMVALGGRGTLIGPVLGALSIEAASAYLSGSLPFVWKLIIGSAFVLVILLLPRGLFAALADAARWLLGRRGEPAGPEVALVATALESGTSAAVPTRDTHAIDVVHVSKSFGSLIVLQDLSFTAQGGELVSLIGPNGAGKTTLMRCLADGRERSSGRIRICGHDIGWRPPNKIVAYGLGRKFQTAAIFETLSVVDCLRIARATLQSPNVWARSDTLALPPPALDVLRNAGLMERLSSEARLLAHGQKQALELAMVLALEPRAVLLDEPTAGLTKAERAVIGKLLVDLQKTAGLCILVVEHDLEFVRDISSRIIVLHQGRIVLDGSVRDVVESALVSEIYSGGAANGTVRAGP